jgi:uncharacterized protein
MASEVHHKPVQAQEGTALAPAEQLGSCTAAAAPAVAPRAIIAAGRRRMLSAEALSTAAATTSFCVLASVEQSVEVRRCQRHHHLSFSRRTTHGIYA